MLEPSIMPLEVARTILQPRMPGFTEALNECKKTWNNEFAPAQRVLDGSARAHVLNQYWYAFTREIFNGDNSIRFLNDQLQRYLVIDEKIILRFKYLDGHLLPKNYPTDHALDWNKQIALEGLPPCVRLHYGYRMDIAGVKIKDAFIILPIGNQNEWIWQTSGEPIDIFGIQTKLPLPNGEKQTVYFYDNYPLEN